MKSRHAAPILLGCSIVALFGCSMFSGSKAESPRALADSSNWQTFGAPLAGAAQEVSLQQLVAEPAKYDGKPIVLRDAKVESVCKRKGCWMVLDEGGTDVRVTFQDYGFFMPLDCEGRATVLEGVFSVTVVPEADARHYLEDAGRPEDALKIVGDQKELAIVATGVRLSK